MPSAEKKTMIILRLTSDACDVEVQQISDIAEMHGMDKPDFHDINSEKDLIDAISTGKSYDYLYLAAHGDDCGLGGEKYNLSWIEFSRLICQHPVLNQGCVLLLACCRGGLNQVSYDIFGACFQIEYVFGPRWTVDGQDITAGFHIFIYNMEKRLLQPDQASKRASDGTGYDFLCYDRLEVVQTQSYKDREEYVVSMVQHLDDIENQALMDQYESDKVSAV